MSTLTSHVFRLPDLGEGLTEAGLVQWLVQVGDTIRTDQAIAEVETAKSVVELPSPFSGVVTALHGEPGDTIPVGAPVLEVADAVPAPSPSLNEPGSLPRPLSERGVAERDETPAPHAASAQETYRTEERAGSGNVLIGYGTSERTTSGRRRRPREAAPAAVSGRPQESRTISPDASAERADVQTSDAAAQAAAPRPGEARRPVAVRSPLVRRLARDLGLDVHTITPTGPDGAITRADVLRAAVDHAVDGVAAASAGAATSGAPAASASDAASAASGTAAGTRDAVAGLSVRARERLSPLRKAASATFSRSRAEIPEATVWVDVDATRLWELRAELAADGRAPSLTALIARFVLLALADHPLLASRLSEDGQEIVTFDGVNLGVAADTPRGLMVPVIPRAHELTVDELDAALRELAETARAGGMPPERLRGSTFTINNYGAFGVDGSAAIINHPEVAILGVGRMIERPWVVDGAIVPRRIAQLSLVFDHRVCDGGYAAGFLRRVVELIEHPLRAYGRV
ncbi:MULTISPECIES: dihydrolipoamide acetyltransferase family protein [Microbacterium]|uniref:dihydrolipoamide acetyltransferase family protein n=1 Tax=Microbacterium TaxID=33882 RepID=UPI00217E3EB1|nr:MULTISPECIES: dihydrolipoamide acetyltransferase family protein [Microbacterium]UWF78008.1 2-oxo acid dehydrogenase subunit E2 [Microbacterium neungamense]WCM56186.1 2-oxo acid dehydrogenase subunit E2 [Microbacterium sp. EF45047]